MSKLLAKQHLNIRFVINHENKGFMLIPRLAPSSKENLHEMAKLYVTRVTSRRSSPMRVGFTPKSGHVRATRDVRFMPIADIAPGRVILTYIVGGSCA